MTLENKVEILEREVNKLRAEKKDVWDVVQILGGFLIPVAIAFVGWQHSMSIKDKELRETATLESIKLEFSRQKEEFNQQISELNSKVSQAKLVASIIQNLIAKDEKEQKLAIESILIGLPVEGPKIVEIIKTTDLRENVKAFAEKKLQSYRSSENVMERFFSPDKAARVDAYNRLRELYGDDKTIIPKLIEMSRKTPENFDATFNVLTFLSQIDPKAIKPYMDEIYAYAIDVEGNGPKTREKVWRLIQDFPCEGAEESVLTHNVLEVPNYIQRDGLKIFPKRINPASAIVSIVDESNEKPPRDLRFAIGEHSGFMHDGNKYVMVLNSISKQFLTGDLRINVSMSKRECQ